MGKVLHPHSRKSGVYLGYSLQRSTHIFMNQNSKIERWNTINAVERFNDLFMTPDSGCGFPVLICPNSFIKNIESISDSWLNEPSLFLDTGSSFVRPQTDKESSLAVQENYFHKQKNSHLSRFMNSKFMNSKYILKTTLPKSPIHEFGLIQKPILTKPIRTNFSNELFLKFQSSFRSLVEKNLNNFETSCFFSSTILTKGWYYYPNIQKKSLFCQWISSNNCIQKTFPGNIYFSLPTFIEWVEIDLDTILSKSFNANNSGTKETSFVTSTKQTKYVKSTKQTSFVRGYLVPLEPRDNNLFHMSMVSFMQQHGWIKDLSFVDLDSLFFICFQQTCDKNTKVFTTNSVRNISEIKRTNIAQKTFEFIAQNKVIENPQTSMLQAHSKRKFVNDIDHQRQIWQISLEI